MLPPPPSPPAGPSDRIAAWGRAEPPAPALPVRAARTALLGLAAGIVGGLAVSVFVYLVAPGHRLPAVVSSQLALWGGMAWAVVTVARRQGASVPETYHFRFCARDIVLGLGASILDRLAAIPPLIVLVLISTRFAGSNGKVIERFEGGAGGTVLVIVIALVGAPLLEELFFRGVLLQSLWSRWPGRLAVVGQGLVFAACHLNPTLGLVNVTVFVATAVFGMGQGLLVRKMGRLGPAVAAHVFFNAVAVVVSLTR